MHIFVALQDTYIAISVSAMTWQCVVVLATFVEFIVQHNKV